MTNQNVPDVVVQAALIYTKTTNLTDALLTLLDAEVKQCDNERCQKTFVFQEGRSSSKRPRKDARFCSPICARRTSQRAYTRRVRQEKREQKGLTNR